MCCPHLALPSVGNAALLPPVHRHRRRREADGQLGSEADVQLGSEADGQLGSEADWQLGSEGRRQWKSHDHARCAESQRHDGRALRCAVTEVRCKRGSNNCKVRSLGLVLVCLFALRWSSMYWHLDAPLVAGERVLFTDVHYHLRCEESKVLTYACTKKYVKDVKE